MRTRRQNIQLELALEPAAKGEARSAGAQGTEARTARAEPERPAAGQEPSMEAVVEPGNLKKALARVRRNKGAPGVDGMTVDELGDHLKAHWPEIRSRLLAGSYTPQPVRRVEIPKPSGGVRLLGVPSSHALTQPSSRPSIAAARTGRVGSGRGCGQLAHATAYALDAYMRRFILGWKVLGESRRKQLPPTPTATAPVVDSTEDGPCSRILERPSSSA